MCSTTNAQSKCLPTLLANLQIYPPNGSLPLQPNN